MFIISDTNILSSLAACESLSLLSRLFPDAVIYIPPAVEQELQVGVNRGQTYVNLVLRAIAIGDIQILDLSAQEREIIPTLPGKLNLGEREAIILAQSRGAPLLSNDKRAGRYCQQHNVEVVDLSDLLRLLWTRRVISQTHVTQLITRMERVENLSLSQADRAKIFAPRLRRRR